MFKSSVIRTAIIVACGVCVAAASGATDRTPDMYRVRIDEQAMKLVDKSTLRVTGTHRTATFHTYFGTLPNGADVPHLAYVKEYDCSAGKVRNLHLTGYKMDGSIAGQRAYSGAEAQWKRVEPESSDSDNQSAICHPLMANRRIKFTGHQQLLIDYLRSLPH